MNIFEKREAIQPYEYPHLLKYANAIWDAFWEPNHFVYDKDVRDFKIELSDYERQVVKRAMLSISVVENKVKSFWGDIYKRMPKTEISDVGSVFSGNETTHRRVYEKILNLLNLEEEFEKVFDVPCMKGRIDYLSKYLSNINSVSNKDFTKSLILFTLLIENCSLFSQFLIVSSFKRYKNVFKNFSEVINATGREEGIHAKFGSELINIIRKENPDWFDQEMEDMVTSAVKAAYEAELAILDWIFEGGEGLDWISKEEVSEYLKKRFNDSLTMIGYNELFITKEELLEKSDFMEVMLTATSDVDFFDQKVIDYNKSKSFKEDSLWD